MPSASRRRPLILAGMAIGLTLFYLTPVPFFIRLHGLLLFAVLALLRPDLAILFVPLTAPLYLIPATLGGLRNGETLLPLHEVALLVTTGAFGCRWIWHLVMRRIAHARSTSTLGGSDDDVPQKVAIKQSLMHWLPLILFLLCGIWGVLIALPTARAEALREFRWLILEPLIFYGLLLVLGRSARRGAAIALIIAGSLVAMIGLFQFVGIDLVPLIGQKRSFSENIVDAGSARRVASVYGHPNNLGLFLGRIWPLAAALALVRGVQRESGVRSQESEAPQSIPSPLAPRPLGELSGEGFSQTVAHCPLPSPAPTGGEGCKGLARGQFPRAPAWERGLGGAGESASGRLRAKTLHLKALGEGKRGKRQEASQSPAWNQLIDALTQPRQIGPLLVVPVYTLATLVCLGGLFVSFSRGAWLGAVVACAVLGFGLVGRTSGASHRRSSLSYRALFAGMIALALLGGLALLLRGGGGSEGVRLLLWREAVGYLVQHPFGIGLDQFYAYHAPDSGRSLIDPSMIGTSEQYAAHPHNLLLDIWLRMGPLGLVAVGWLIARVIRRTSAADPLLIGALAALAAALTHGLVDQFYFVPDLAITFWVLLALSERSFASETGASQ